MHQLMEGLILMNRAGTVRLLLEEEGDQLRAGSSSLGAARHASLQ